MVGRTNELVLRQGYYSRTPPPFDAVPLPLGTIQCSVYNHQTILYVKLGSELQFHVTLKEDQRQNQTGGRDFCFLASPDPFIRPKTCKSAIPLGHDHWILDRYRYTGYAGNICASKQHTRAVQDSNRPNDWKKSALNIIRTNQIKPECLVTQHLIYCKHARCIYTRRNN